MIVQVDCFIFQTKFWLKTAGNDYDSIKTLADYVNEKRLTVPNREKHDANLDCQTYVPYTRGKIINVFLKLMIEERVTQCSV